MEKSIFIFINMHNSFLILKNYFDSILLELLQIFINIKFNFRINSILNRNVLLITNIH